MMTQRPAKEALWRCPWAGTDPLYVAYHDKEWGVPKATDQALFEKLILEGFQAGLSWITILRKRENFRKAFDGFDADRIVRFNKKKIESLMANPGIVRNRAKIEATMSNARAYLDLQEKMSFSAFLWNYVEGRPIINRPKSLDDLPAKTDLSSTVAKDLKAHGFRFCGPTTVYALMQSVGMINDHLIACHRHQACSKLGQKFKAPKT